MSLILAFGSSLAVVVPVWADEPLPQQGQEAGVLPGPDGPIQMPVPVGFPVVRKPLQGSVEQSGAQGGLQGGAQGSAPLQGSIQQSGLQGGAQNTGLTGGAQGGDWMGAAQQGRADQGRPMQGFAGQQPPMQLNAMNDPDGGDQELQIDWDRWRNTLQQTIQSGTMTKINVHNDIHFVWDPRTQMMQTRYPNGITAWYACDVLPNRRIINIRLNQSSRYPSFDQAVLQSINELQGNRILVYPSGSKRQIVSQQAGVSTAATSSFQNMKFGDVERQRY